MKKTTKKLSLTKSTIRSLTRNELNGVGGAAALPTSRSTCASYDICPDTGH